MMRFRFWRAIAKAALRLVNLCIRNMELYIRNKERLKDAEATNGE